MKSSNSDHTDRANIRWSETWNTLPEAFIPSLAAPKVSNDTYMCRSTHLVIHSVDRHPRVSIDAVYVPCVDRHTPCIDRYMVRQRSSRGKACVDRHILCIDRHIHQRDHSSSRFRTDPLGLNPDARGRSCTPRVHTRHQLLDFVSSIKFESLTIYRFQDSNLI